VESRRAPPFWSGPSAGPRNVRARAGVSGAYFVQGLCFAGLLTQVPSLKDKFHFTEDDLTLVLLAVPVIAGLGSVLAGVLAPRLGSAIVLRISGPLVGVAMTVVGLVPSRLGLYLAVAFFGLFLGAVDASMNMQGVGVQRRYGRSLLASFHGWWSLAGILGALATAGANKINMPLPAALGTVAAVGVAAALSVGPLLLRRSEEASDAMPPLADEPRPRFPWAPIVLVGLAVMLMYISDSATSNWGAVYLHDALHGSKSIAALGLGAYLTCQVLGRAGADRLVRRFGPVRVVAIGGLVGAAGMALVAAAPRPAVGVLGFAIVGAGLCVVVPQSFSAAGALDPTGSGVAVARVNLFNYVGFVVGAALIGAVAKGTGLRWAFVTPAVLALGIVALAPSFAVARRNQPEVPAAAAPARDTAARDTAARDTAARDIAAR
jgi:MFS family permease